MKVTRTTLALVAVIVVLALALAFQLGHSGGDTNVDARDCGEVEQSGWHFKSC